MPTLCPLKRYDILFALTLVRDSAWFTGIGSVTGALTVQSRRMLNRYLDELPAAVQDAVTGHQVPEQLCLIQFQNDPNFIFNLII